LQSALAHCRLSLQESLSGKLWGVGVFVAVGVGVGVAVGVAVNATQPEKSHTPADEPTMQGEPIWGKQKPPRLPPKQVWHWPHGGVQPPPMFPALARLPANSRSIASTTSPTRFIVAPGYYKTARD
jgi:hypothetical protein